MRTITDDMWTICLHITAISIVRAVTYSLYDTTYSNNGWIPITSDQVYKAHIPRDVLYNSDLNTQENYFDIELATEPIMEEDISTADYDIKLNEDQCREKDSRTCNEIPPDDLHLTLEKGFIPNLFKLKQPKNKTLRKSKKILHDSVQSNNEINIKEIGVNEKSYEVTEESIIEDLEPKHETGNGYFYNQPNNYTNKLLKLLLKYHIKSSDNLPNYSKSLRYKTQYPEKEYLSPKPFDYQIPFRYNSLNHLPVDPLMAVFLSNYGYYLQGQYGKRNNYNNLYGYLASNNIHNNKPFGLYKVFADTDSSN